MSVKKIFAKKYISWWLVCGGVILLLIAGGLWWCKLSVTPERVFWGTIDQSLQTTGVTLNSTSMQGEASLEQHLQYSLGTQNRALVSTTLRQGGAVVTTETLGTIGADYTRYAHVQTERTATDGGPIDLSNVLNVWAKTEQPAGSSQTLSQTILGLSVPLGSIPVPIGNLSSEQRNKLVNQIKNEGVYEVSFKDVKKEKKDGRLYYTYTVKIQSIPYVHLMKEFAKQIGLKDLEQVEPNDYQGEPLTVEIKVDARARQIVEVYVSLADARQRFTSYDIPVSVEAPTDSVSAEELQRRLNEL